MSLKNIWRKFFRGEDQQPKETIQPRRDPNRIKGGNSHIKMKKMPFPTREE